jgi:hypothetical protein
LEHRIDRQRTDARNLGCDRICHWLNCRRRDWLNCRRRDWLDCRRRDWLDCRRRDWRGLRRETLQIGIGRAGWDRYARLDKGALKRKTLIKVESLHVMVSLVDDKVTRAPIDRACGETIETFGLRERRTEH